MSQRPRLAGDGRLSLPAKVAFDNQGFIRGRYSDETVDPFGWTADRLLLAESFARLDLKDRPSVKAWLVNHGALNPFDFTGGDAATPDDGEWAADRPPNAFAESRAEDANEQGNVQWHLATLVRLSDNRTTRRWDPAWGEFLLRADPATYLMGGYHTGTEVWSLWWFDFVRQRPDADQRKIELQTALLPEVARRTRVSVRDSAWYGYWENDGIVDVLEKRLRPDLGSLGSTWESALELERLLMEPYVAQAVERRFRIDRLPSAHGRTVLVPREAREWTSVLAPIYLQLFEALRRISEGEPGAAVCRECGQPFLVLDARRRFFCNDRDRFRFSQRERRRRLGAMAPE